MLVDVDWMSEHCSRVFGECGLLAGAAATGLAEWGGARAVATEYKYENMCWPTWSGKRHTANTVTV
jgi:hypothetical protein